MHLNQVPQSKKPFINTLYCKHVYAKSTQRRDRKFNLLDILVACLFPEGGCRKLSLL